MPDYPVHAFVPRTELDGVPNIMVDGAAAPDTVLTLSHWPKSGTPDALKADTSTEIVFTYLGRPDAHVPVHAVSGDHFDEDGVIGVFAMLEPDFAVAHRELLIEAATAGDFGRTGNRQAARIAFTIAALGDARRSPLPAACFPDDYAAMTAALFREVLPRLKPIVEHTAAFEELWRDEDAFFAASDAGAEAGTLAIEEVADADLAVVTVPEGWSAAPGNPVAEADDRPYHAMAVHNRTRRDRILTVQGSACRLDYRYEGWVQMTDRTVPPRVDLAPLAEQLTADEPAGTAWQADPVHRIRPALTTADGRASGLEVQDIVARVAEHLRTAEAAWDPYDRPDDPEGTGPPADH